MPTQPLAKKSWDNPGYGLRSTPVNDNEWGQTKFGSKEWSELSVGIILECLITVLIIMGVLWSQSLANTVGFLCFPLVWSTNHASVLMQTDCKKALSNVATTRAWSAREPRVLRSRKSTFSMLSILLSTRLQQTKLCLSTNAYMSGASMFSAKNFLHADYFTLKFASSRFLKFTIPHSFNFCTEISSSSCWIFKINRG